MNTLSTSAFMATPLSPSRLASGASLRWRFLAGLLCLGLPAAAQPAPALRDSVALQQLAAAAVQRAVAETPARNLKPEELALTIVSLQGEPPYASGSHRGEELIYPASVIKLFYLAATHHWIEQGRLTDSAEIQRAMKDMIVDSSNDATHYLIDLLTGTTSGPELPEDELARWFERRNAVTRHFADLGYRGVIAHKKPWGDGPYGRESQAIRAFDPKRNMLTTAATAQLLAAIATGRAVSPERSQQMMTLLARPLRPTDADDQALFTGPALPDGSLLWSKAGWTSQTRHDAAIVQLPSGQRFIWVLFTVNHAREPEILRRLARAVVDGLTQPRGLQP